MKPWHVIIYCVAALLGFSIVTVYSTDMTTSGSCGSGYQSIKHIVWIGISSLLLTVMSKIDYHYLQKLSIPLLVVSFILLVLVLVPGIGTVTNGARRWIRLNRVLGIQPSEFAKLVMLIFIANYLAKNQGRMSQFIYGFVIPMGVAVVISALVLKEPDFGTAAFIAILSLILLMIGGTRMIYVIFAAMAVTPCIHKMLFDVPFRKIRLLVFLDPWKDPSGAGYQIIQSWIALGSGGLTGLGLGSSRQKLFFLPESNSDFIFTIIGEEFGFLGASLVIGLFLLLVWHGLKIVHAAKDVFGFFLGLGITVMFGLQAILNIAVVSGVLPTKGIPLPFVSSGGSSLLFSMIGVGILVNIARQSSLPETINVPAEKAELSENKLSSISPLKV